MKKMKRNSIIAIILFLTAITIMIVIENTRVNMKAEYKNSDETYASANGSEKPEQTNPNQQADGNDSSKGTKPELTNSPKATVTLKPTGTNSNQNAKPELTSPPKANVTLKPEKYEKDTAQINDKRKKIAAIYDEIDAILEKSSKGSNNPMANLLGFSDDLEAIAAEASKAMQLEGESIKSINQCDNITLLSQCEISASDYLNSFINQKDNILKAKQNQDINLLQQELQNMLSIIKNYEDYLQEVP